MMGVGKILIYLIIYYIALNGILGQLGLAIAADMESMNETSTVLITDVLDANVSYELKVSDINSFWDGWGLSMELMPWYVWLVFEVIIPTVGTACAIIIMFGGK